MKKAYVSIIFALLALNYVSSKSIIDNLKLPSIETVPFAHLTRHPNAINIETSLAKPTTTPIPLIVLGSLLDLSNATNTGSTLQASLLPRPPLFTLAGGILLGKSYDFSHRDFYWDLGLNRSAYTTLDGYGPSLVNVNNFVNTDCHEGYDEALTRPDGVVQVVCFINVTEAFNLLFLPTQLKLMTLKKAGSSILVSEFFDFIYLFFPTIPQRYYYYRVSYKNRDSGEINYTTVIVYDYKIPPFISKGQFYALFGSLEDYAGDHYSNAMSATTVDKIQIGVAEGVVADLSLFS